MHSSLAEFLSSEQHAVYGAVRALAQRDGASVYLVGGAVRDWLMNQPVGDLDFSVEGDAIAFAQALQRAHGGNVQAYEKFGTATWTAGDQSVDIATARSETYPRPAILPVVAPSDIERDLARRDFTINAMALRLRDEELLDPFGGQRDIEARCIRALHARSFVDDPTRMLRAARYAARFAFAVEPNTRHWIDAGLQHLRGLSGERVKYDLELTFDIDEPEGALALLDEWGAFKALGIAVPDAARLRARFTRMRELLPAWDGAPLQLPAEMVARAAAWGALIYNLGQLSASRWIELIPYTAEARDALVSLGVLSTLTPSLFAGKASAQSELLRSFSGLALLIGWLFDGDARKRQAMYDEWHTWRRVQPATSGDDLRARGLPPGPRYKALLARLRNAWLDGEVHSADEERLLLNRLL
jgi:tRNA nucleotidyltransferase (CCA-adding enzyme)